MRSREQVHVSVFTGEANKPLMVAKHFYARSSDILLYFDCSHRLVPLKKMDLEGIECYGRQKEALARNRAHHVHEKRYLVHLTWLLIC